MYSYRRFGACRRRTPRGWIESGGWHRRRSRRGASLGTLTSARFLGVRRRHASEMMNKKRTRPHKGLLVRRRHAIRHPHFLRRRWARLVRLAAAPRGDCRALRQRVMACIVMAKVTAMRLANHSYGLYTYGEGDCRALRQRSCAVSVHHTNQATGSSHLRRNANGVCLNLTD